MIDAMEKATRSCGGRESHSGHGALSNLDDVRAFTKMLKETSAVVQKALSEHKPLDRMKQEKFSRPGRNGKAISSMKMHLSKRSTIPSPATKENS